MDQEVNETEQDDIISECFSKETFQRIVLASLPQQYGSKGDFVKKTILNTISGHIGSLNAAHHYLRTRMEATEEEATSTIITFYVAGFLAFLKQAPDTPIDVLNHIFNADLVAVFERIKPLENNPETLAKELIESLEAMNNEANKKHFMRRPG